MGTGCPFPARPTLYQRFASVTLGRTSGPMPRSAAILNLPPLLTATDRQALKVKWR